MADVVTVIGRGSFVRGRITGSGSLEIAGRVEGEVSVSGDLTVDASGLVAANLSGRRLVIRGAVKGDLNATEAVVLEAGAKVVGDLHSPRVAIAEGALVRGHVATGGGSTTERRTSAASSSRADSRGEPRAIAKEPPTARMPPMENHARKAAPHPAPSSKSGNATMPRGSVLAGTKPMPKGAPAPVVPVLKKGTKATQKKRA
jgi:cytoskeletal protein CcmA (bactofilin family)